MEFGNEICAMCIVKNGKRESAEVIELLNQEKENYLGILEAHTNKQAEKN